MNTTSSQQSLNSVDASLSLTPEQLMQRALQRKEGTRADNGALCVGTGARTGRSPKDRFIVDDALTHDNVAWSKANQPISTEKFEALWKRVTSYLADKETFNDRLAVGADVQYQIPVNVTTELAWHLLCCQHLFIRHVTATTQPAWTLLNAANFKTDPERDGG